MKLAAGTAATIATSAVLYPLPQNNLALTVPAPTSEFNTVKNIVVINT